MLPFQRRDPFFKAIPAFKPIQGELIAYKGSNPEKVYQFSDEASDEVDDVKSPREKVKRSRHSVSCASPRLRLVFFVLRFVAFQ